MKRERLAKVSAACKLYTTKTFSSRRKRSIETSSKRISALDYVNEHLRSTREKVNYDESTPKKQSRNYVRKKHKLSDQVVRPKLSQVAYGNDWWTDLMDKEAEKKLDVWISENRLPEEAPNMTRDALCQYFEDSYNTGTTPEQISRLLHHLGYEWSKLKCGYFVNKMANPDVLAHRSEYIPFLEYLEHTSNNCAVLYFDESQFRERMYETHGWCKRGKRGSKIDKRQKTGKGHGYRISAFLVYVDGQCSILRDSDGLFVGTINSTYKSTSKSAKESDTAQSFLSIIRKGIIAQKALTPNKKVVCVIDGARTHTTFGSHMLKPLDTMNLRKVTEEKPHTLECELKKLGLWPDNGLSMKKASQLFRFVVFMELFSC